MFYIDKDKQEIKEFIVSYDPALVQSLLQNLKDLKKKIESDTVPLVLQDYPNNWQCSYCQFREVCDRAGKEILSWQEFKQKIEKQEV